MKVFLAGSSLQPAYGGPARSVSRLAVALTEIGVEVGLWAPDQSATTTPFIDPSSPVHRLTGTPVEAVDSFGAPDILHDNGVWLRHNHQLASLAAARDIPRVVSTRGMLEPWALNHKGLKKRMAWSLYQRRDLKIAAAHHTTSAQEAQNLRRLCLDVPVRTIPNGVDVPEKPRHLAAQGLTAKRTALFLGRIYPVKGLPLLIEAWARVRPHDWILKIAGPDEAGHRGDIEALVAAADLSRAVSFVGPVQDDVKTDLLFGADLLVTPSHSESFGGVIAEGLAHGVPVLTTTTTPWQAVTERRCGWCVSPTTASIAEALQHATAMSPEKLHEMGERGRAFVSAGFAWHQVARQFVEMYASLGSLSLQQ